MEQEEYNIKYRSNLPFPKWLKKRIEDENEIKGAG